MGTTSSTPLAAIERMELLTRLSGPEPIPHDDPFWKQLLAPGPHLAALDPAELEAKAGAHFRRMAELNPTTHNCQVWQSGLGGKVFWGCSRWESMHVLSVHTSLKHLGVVALGRRLSSQSDKCGSNPGW